MIVDKDIVVMASEPSPELTIDMAYEVYADVSDEKALADIFSIVENKSWWIEDEVYDYEEGTDEYKQACEITKKWFDLADRIKNDIFEILSVEGVKIPKSGQIVVLEPFMKRNGYLNRDGWWIKEE